MNLENLNLVELNAQEVQEVEGGFPLIWHYAGQFCTAYENVRNAGILFGLGALAGVGDGIRSGMN
jgi:hypothetical protein